MEYFRNPLDLFNMCGIEIIESVWKGEKDFGV